MTEKFSETKEGKEAMDEGFKAGQESERKNMNKFVEMHGNEVKFWIEKARQEERQKVLDKVDAILKNESYQNYLENKHHIIDNIVEKLKNLRGEK